METGFIWKGIHSSEKGLKIISLPNISTPEKREDKTIVPGRSGYLTIDDDSYEGEVKTVEFDIKHDNFDDIKSWLSGSGEVIFSNEPDRYYKARIINKVDLARVLEKFHSGIVQFDCQPFGYSLDKKPITWNDELLYGLSGDDYDLEKIYYGDKVNASIETIDNKKWIKYNTTSTTFRLATINGLRPNTIYTYSFNIITQNEGNIICSNWGTGVKMYGGKTYNVGNKPIRLHHTFTTPNDVTSDIFHIVDLNSNEVYYFSDFRLIEGTTEGENLIRGSLLNLHENTNYGIAIKPVGLDLLKDNVYTFTVNGSVEEEFLKAGGYLRFYIYENTWKEHVAVIDIKSTQNITASGRFIPSATGKYYFGAYRYPKDISQSSNGYVNANWGKLEEGDKSTPWNMSPLDKELVIENKGTRKSKPTITVYATGDVNLYINKETVKLKNVEDKITINTEMMEAYKDTLPQNNKMYGEFPTFTIGSNNITWEGNVNRIEVQQNTVFL